MSQRICYFRNNHYKGLKDLIIENFIPFRNWYLDCHKSSIEEYCEHFEINKLMEYLSSNKNFIDDFDNLEKKLVDELTSLFVGSYCDLTDEGNRILELFGPAMSKWRYEETNELVLSINDNEFLKLWNFLLKGRSLKDNQSFDSFTNEYKIGFLSSDECIELKEKIETYFGDILHNPKASGFEFVLAAFQELDGKNIEIVTGIE